MSPAAPYQCRQHRRLKLSGPGTCELQRHKAAHGRTDLAACLDCEGPVANQDAPPVAKQPGLSTEAVKAGARQFMSKSLPQAEAPASTPLVTAAEAAGASASPAKTAAGREPDASPPASAPAGGEPPAAPLKRGDPLPELPRLTLSLRNFINPPPEPPTPVGPCLNCGRVVAKPFMYLHLCITLGTIYRRCGQGQHATWPLCCHECARPYVALTAAVFSAAKEILVVADDAY